MMNFVPLTAEQRRAFAEDGFLVVRNALDRELLERLRGEADEVAEAFLRKPAIAGKPEYNHLDWRRGLLKKKALLALVAHAPTVSLVVQLLSPNIHLHSTTVIYKRSETADTPAFRRGWHRDIRMARDFGHKNLPLAGIKICYCLTDFSQAESGMTLMARGTHLRTEPLRIPKGALDPLDAEVCDLQLNAGDALLFENRIFHTAAPNRSERTSKVVIYGYAYRWLRPEVYLESPDERQLLETDPITRQLLGGYRDIDTPPWALDRWAKKHGVAREKLFWTTEV
jgi:ectoine hydroxylase-related dioxygenase (phytanoyl-CoA dioxygenase family)